ncbi:MAG: tRNA epoxyqueuosine(34) reductase QueG [Bdellovibrionaceae bacterium]|nr:tRNA epoxyqueuosine(34) reductase QueG [Pseudobdellovibrionaceae bacterium]
MAQIEDQIKALGFQRVGMTSLEPAISLRQYEEWLAKDYHGDMTYLQTHLAHKTSPSNLVPRAISALVVSCNYFPEVPGSTDLPFKANRVALYARGEDYHHWFKERLEALCQSLSEMYKDQVFWPATDSAPLLERDLAYRAGLGWIGKNTCLIHRRQGSLFFIGEILTSLPAPATATPSPDHCGTCHRCLDVCPTQAFTKEREMDARKCISYWTIEAKTSPPLELRDKMDGWLFGCDLCQTVCPWNEKIFGPSLREAQSVSPSDPELESELRLILTTSNKELNRQLRRTPLARAGGRGLKRNALLVAAHYRLTGLTPEIEMYLSHPRLGELADWTLNRISSHPSASEDH